MKNFEVIRNKQKLDDIYNKVRELQDNIELQAHFARYLCVLTSGFIETSIRAILNDHVKNAASPHVANYVAFQLRRLQNPKTEQIYQQLRAFNPNWADSLAQQTLGELKDSVDSIVSNRHAIAHGLNVGISYVSVRRYYEGVIKFIDLLEQECS